MGKSGAGKATSVRERASRGQASASSKAATLSKNGKRVGRPPMSAEEKAAKTQARKDKANAARRESAASRREAGMPHAMSAAERARAGLPREAQPGENLHLLARGEGTRVDPFAKLSVSLLQRLYGDHQLGNALSVYSLSKLKDDVLPGVMAQHPGTKPANSASRASVVSYITRMVTGGKYSADFAKVSGQAKSGSARAPRTAEQEARRAASAQKRAADKAAFARAERVAPTSRVDTRQWFRSQSAMDLFNARLNPYFTQAQYGSHQLRDALGGYSLKKLREAADVVNRRNGWTARSANYVRGTTRQALLDRIAQAVIAHPSGPFVADNLYS